MRNFLTEQRAVMEDSCVVDQYVGTSQVVSGPLDGLEDFLLFGYVTFQRVDLSFGAGIKVIFQCLFDQIFNENSCIVKLLIFLLLKYFDE